MSVGLWDASKYEERLPIFQFQVLNAQASEFGRMRGEIVICTITSSSSTI